jgi:hypothetical protein
MSKKEKLEYLFDLYVANLQNLAPKSKPVFVCPLCLRKISKPQNLDDVVSEEHIIPDSLGGNITTLTCRKCNNDDGSRLDAHLIQRIRVEQGDYSINSRITVGDGEFGADIYFSNKKDTPNTIVGVSKQSNPKSVEIARIALEANPEEISLNLKLGYNYRASLVGLIRIAYLMMFRYFGYSYILRDCVEQIRRQISHPFLELPVIECVRWKIEDLSVANIVSVITEPEEFRAFYVIIKLTTDAKHLSGVIFPGFGQQSKNIYSTLAQIKNKETFTIFPLPTQNLKHNDIQDPLKTWNVIFK